MAVDWADLDREKFAAMSPRETVRGVPQPGHGNTATSLTKKQIATLVMISRSSVSGFGQIRHYPERPGRRSGAMPSPSVPETLAKEGYVSVGDRRQVARRTGRGPSGFEKKQEGGYVNAYRSDDVLDALAEKLGYGSRFDENMTAFMKSQLEEM